MLPTAGGTDNVRGFAQHRFRDRNALVLNAEYRRPLVSLLDVVLFADAGRVFPRARDFSFNRLQTAAGAGARLKFGSRVFFGIDAGFSREGAQLWFRSGHTF
jgi:outer membrane protein assembly factor BamA